MKITVVTVVKNASHTVADTVCSVAGQDYPDVEHLVVDGGSVDATRDVVLRAGLPPSNLIVQPDNGVYQGFNCGLSAATGDVVGFLNGDDVFDHPGVLRKIAEQFFLDDCDATYGDLVYVSRDDMGYVIRYWRAGMGGLKAIRYGWMPPHPTLYLKRKLVTEVGSYDETYRISGDYEYFLRVSQFPNLRMAYIPRVLVRMRAGGMSNWPPSHHLRKWREDLRALRQHEIGGAFSLLAKNLRKLPQVLSPFRRQPKTKDGLVQRDQEIVPEQP